MKSRRKSVLHSISMQLNRSAAFLDRLPHPASTGSKFVDLAPTEEADKEGVYAEALTYATNNQRVFNIALTGPYGSGKSSIIKSFLKRYPRPTLNISLAAFVPGVDAASKEVHRQEIERSILQQMLYGADANRLPLSRFKRIRSPGFWSIFKTLFILIGLAATAYLFPQPASDNRRHLLQPAGDEQLASFGKHRTCGLIPMDGDPPLLRRQLRPVAKEHIVEGH